jgi:SAM-dependent methyltransferase
LEEPSYRQTFSRDASAARYDEVVYAAGSSADLLWQVEYKILRALAADALRGKPAATYLDFACGTGRVLSSLEDLAAQAVGIDVSAAMLERARARCRKATLICADITRTNGSLEGQYDLITSFRFLTNAEPALRSAALRALHARLNDGGTLLINTHGNPWSYRLVLLPYHWLKDRFAGRPLFGYLSNRETRRLLQDAGFRVEAVIGMGFVPQKLLPVMGARLAGRIESSLADAPGVQRFGLNQLFVCRKA